MKTIHTIPKNENFKLRHKKPRVNCNMSKQIYSFVESLCGEEHYDENEGCWYFKSGGACLTCTDSAIKIAHKFSGIVCGYYSIHNVAAIIGHSICNGHDFALIQDRFLVDYWVYRIAGLLKFPV